MRRSLLPVLIIGVNVLGLFLFTWPLFLNIEEFGLANLTQATWLAALFALIAVGILALSINVRLLDSKTVAIVSVLVGLISALRLLGAGAVGIEPIWIALGVGLIPRNLKFKVERFALALYGVLAALLFGLLMDLQLWPWLLGSDTQLSYLPGASVTENFSRFITFHFATALSWDLPRAIITAILIVITARPVLNALNRANTRLNAVADWREVNERAKAQTAISPL